ncbi:hypothetical protein CYMTET_19853 [Cymbomonas tetramitiformis]|uniref:Exostosin GT47 domain-containing protein n=1 Tax=Cymbomonas tetramitiformis TaxID=36881 RepID=A0AAE0G6H6_9CHLO|nr:hypothetical protein CYMTET_19853 [Cymbomonas tetramitiformis]
MDTRTKGNEWLSSVLFSSWNGMQMPGLYTVAVCLRARVLSSGRALGRWAGKVVAAQGFCHCKPGFYGFDCSLVWDQQLNRSQLFWQQHYRTEARVMRPAIYVYDLPPQHFSWQIARYMGMKGDFGRQIGYAFTDRLMSSAYRTADASEADFFFVPCLGSRHHSRPSCMEYLRHHWTYWNASISPDHIWIGADDGGSRAYLHMHDAERADFNKHSIFLQHFGGHYGSERVVSGTFVPGVDINIPPLEASWVANDRYPPASPYFRPNGLPKDDAFEDLSRNYTFFFAGAVIKDPRIRNNVRWKVYNMSFADPGYVVVNSLENNLEYPKYLKMLARSKFCLAPAGKGGGWGLRFVHAVLSGCVPVMSQVDFTEVFQELLPLKRFVVVLDEDTLGDLPAKVAEAHAQLRHMQVELQCAWPYLTWSSIYGRYANESGRMDAFTTVMEILYRRSRGLGLLHSPCSHGLHQHQKDYLSQLREEAGHTSRTIFKPIACSVFDCSEEAEQKPRSAVNWGDLHERWPPGGAACAHRPLDQRPCI